MLKSLILETLKEQPNFRERSRRSRGFAILLQRTYPVLQNIPLDTLVSAMEDYGSMDRLWRDALLNDPSLRGKDYLKGKENLEKNYQQSLGYDVGETFGEFKGVAKTL